MKKRKPTSSSRSRTKRQRERGGASHPCPECGGATHVQVTRRREGTVERQRQCLECGSVFRTREEHLSRAEESRL